MHILVLAGGLSPERDVSLRSGRRVAEAIRLAQPMWEVTEADVDDALLPWLTEHRPDAIVPLLHGSAGEDGSLRDVLETLDLDYLGSSAAASRMAFDKAVANTLVSGFDIAVPEFVVLPQSLFRELGARAVMEAVGERLAFPLVVKPLRGGSALGVSMVKSAEELPAAMVSAFSYGETAIIQRFISGTEIAACIVETPDPHVLPLVEIVPPGDIYDYNARYTAGTTEFFCPARVNATDAQRISDVAVTIHTAFGLEDYSRIDLILDAEGTIWFLEVNVAPGMTETSLMPQAIAADGLDMGQVVTSIIGGALEQA